MALDPVKVTCPCNACNGRNVYLILQIVIASNKNATTWTKNFEIIPNFKQAQLKMLEDKQKIRFGSLDESILKGLDIDLNFRGVKQSFRFVCANIFRSKVNRTLLQGCTFDNV